MLFLCTLFSLTFRACIHFAFTTLMMGYPVPQSSLLPPAYIHILHCLLFIFDCQIRLTSSFFFYCSTTIFSSLLHSCDIMCVFRLNLDFISSKLHCCHATRQRAPHRHAPFNVPVHALFSIFLQSQYLFFCLLNASTHIQRGGEWARRVVSMYAVHTLCMYIFEM